MKADELFARIKVKPQPPVDNDGQPIVELDGLMLKGLSAVDMTAMSEYTDAYGKGEGWRMVLARGIVNPDGTQVIPDERAAEFDQCHNGPLARAIDRIRTLSGLSRPDDAEGQKKTSSTTPAPTESPSSSTSPGTSGVPSDNCSTEPTVPCPQSNSGCGPNTDSGTGSTPTE